MIINQDLSIYHKVARLADFVSAYFLFATILYFILLLTHHQLSYSIIMILVACLNLFGWLLKKILK